MRILIIDDESRIRSAMGGLLRDQGYGVVDAPDGNRGIALFSRELPDVVLLDVMLPGMDGIEVLKRIRSLDEKTRVIMMSGQSDIGTAVEATRLGALNFLEKPVSPDRLLLEMKNCEKQWILEKKVQELEARSGDRDLMVGESEAMAALRAAIQKAAPSEGRVLILGENGSGKELVARAVHRGSPRKNHPFVSLNCAALPGNLVESELFGYEKGAFTGALKRKPGRFETADRGTLFLDEIGDMGLETQAKLLRVLQENEALRLGGEEPVKFNVRIIAATNKDLQREIREGRFREDLYFRLNVIPLQVPPLRDRPGDIPLLVHHFTGQIAARTGLGLKRWDEEALQLLTAYDWPGNVRELQNMVERLIIMCSGPVIPAGEVRQTLPGGARELRTVPPEETSPERESGLSLKEQVENFEKEVIRKGYRRTGGNVSHLARLLKTDRANLYRKLKTYGIKE